MSTVFFTTTTMANPMAYRASPAYAKLDWAETKRDEQNAVAADLGIQTRYHVAEGKSADFDKKDSRPAS